MILKRERVLKIVLDALSRLKSGCEFRGKSGLFDLNKIAEFFFCPFLNELYGFSLKVLPKGQPAIDLGDLKSGTAFQITSDGGKAKIQDTLNKYAKHKLFDPYPHLMILIIGKRRDVYSLIIPKNVSFNQDTDIVDLEALGAKVTELSTTRVGRLAAIIESEFEQMGRSEKCEKAPFLPLEVLVNGESIQVPDAACTFAPDAGWEVELVLRNASSEVMEPGDVSIALVLPRKLIIKDEWSRETPKYLCPIRLDRSKMLWEMTHFDRLLPGTTKKYTIPLRGAGDRPLKVGENAKAMVCVHTKYGSAEYVLRIHIVTSAENLTAIQKREKRASSSSNAHAILKLSSFIRALEGESKNNLPSISWKRTFSPIDPECKNLFKTEIIPRIFRTTNRADLVNYLGAVKAMYAAPMKRQDVRERFAQVCVAFGINIGELV